ncbi:Tfp pilus assembly protein FimT/FimU [Vibrio tubiashii]|uniref:Uncharacterized protein n=1 Tax=Vibrio tubiashii ATCC 19109 TaxID=1051646 RepID=F9T6S9_9VIBR|nr:type II secretion system protein [Vibrio tubiashii]AIW17493.1 hypothetical protein IX91_25895 [Vibrio tubiashii ATCC 19109]EGU54484.1 hypothetical protein VITU9109_02882 [Vibrio tubiashii ATCC 19109]EIF05993.1 hypothetical protein VT1337_00600 [Vibrio tubiashii NCIMB 1337 = ATCC 19106]
MRRKQRGISLLSLAVVVAILGGLATQALPLIHQARINEDAEKLKNQVTYLWEQTKTYQADRFNAGIPYTDLASFPATVDDLMPDYLPQCSVTDYEGGKCRRIDYTPMGERITLNRQFVTLSTGATVPGMRIVIPFKNEPSPQILNTFKSKLSDLPNGQYNETSKEFILQFGRIGSEVEHEALVQRDGSTTLTGADWDTGGNTWITNIKGLFLRNADGSQYSVASGLQRVAVVDSGTFIPTHSCPSGHRPDLDVMIKSIEPRTNAEKFTSIGSFTPYYTAVSGGWRVYAKYFAKLQGGSKQWVFLDSAYLKVTQLCVQ